LIFFIFLRRLDLNLESSDETIKDINLRNEKKTGKK